MSSATDFDAQFASRFGPEDAEFQRYRQRAPDVPPVLEDWKARGRRDRRGPEQWHHEGRSRGQYFPERRWNDRRGERYSSHESYSQRSHYSNR
ncbi:RNA guanine-N7 methyltransferase activating subunit-like [Myxocyprinus asiaticus]|uniref:RNA guanine-N7 methyltransferase activating subunit-like n=1 Tax=Myxocyprinus asiaticus TaxID=70543 RepID=UPI00222311D6|nr:RNA guanine-N7 methyltransferase activating subunit-like [Myxocyprinus asiaticus]